jgi:hypothetical protein
MAPLLFVCPKTNQRAPTGIETDVQSLSASWRAMLKVDCPHCGETHEISVRETYMARYRMLSGPVRSGPTGSGFLIRLRAIGPRDPRL